MKGLGNSCVAMKRKEIKGLADESSNVSFLFCLLINEYVFVGWCVHILLTKFILLVNRFLFYSKDQYYTFYAINFYEKGIIQIGSLSLSLSLLLSYNTSASRIIPLPRSSCTNYQRKSYAIEQNTAFCLL